MASMFSRLFGGAANPQPGWIAAADLAPHLTGDNAPLVLDVRGVGEFMGPLGHIEGARNIPLDQLAGETAALVAHDGPIVCVCHTDRRSAAAAAHLRAAGATDVTVLRGGMLAWRSEGR